MAASPRIAILGAGPIGLEAGLYARTLNLPVTIYERGRTGEHLQRWGHVRLFSPFGMNSTSLGRAAIRAAKPNHDFPADDACITGREHVAAYLSPLSQAETLKGCIQNDVHVMSIGRRGFLKAEDPGDAARARQPFRLLLRDKQKGERLDEADVVLDCTGTYGQHRWVGDGGIPAIGELTAEPSIVYGLDDVVGDRKNLYAGKTTLVVGGGFSAATSVCNLAALATENPATWIIWLARAAGTQPLHRHASDPFRERDRLAARANNLATRNDGNVEFHPQSVIDAVEFLGQDKGFRVSGRSAGKKTVWEVDRMIANVGYTPDTTIYRELRVHECYASLGPMKLAAVLLGQGADSLNQAGQAGRGPLTLKNPEPNFHILGAKSYGRNSLFLLRLGFEQIRDVFTLIMVKGELDLYRKR